MDDISVESRMDDISVESRRDDISVESRRDDISVAPSGRHIANKMTSHFQVLYGRHILESKI